MAASFRRKLWLFRLIFLLGWVLVSTAEAAEKTPGVLTVGDALTLPNQSVRIEAQLAGKAPGGSFSWGGVSVHLSIDGKSVATAKTNDSGQVSFEYLPKMRGNYVVTVSVDDAASVAAEKTDATLCVWERRRPIILVEMAALVQPVAATPTETGTEASAQPVPDAAEELARLTQYYYNVVYVWGSGQPPAETVAIGNARRWLTSHRFPPGFVAVPSADGVNGTVERFKQGGWATMKTGIVRTRAVAETLLQHRFEVVVVPELPKGEMPRKAKAAKEWKDVRKRL
ncbi:MAG: hypothetical protein KA240_18520 [Nitrospira sp.]|nr:hypothetical protein [Nitrospira sp.]MBP6607677.1 hypothetical protein [Nitrospira sp.]HQY58975.1 hypothetical protein [Nitrospira sp.]HRA96190.1 hypothetical protein [Nitrospira sp.]